MIEEIKLKSQSDRINYLLSCLSGITNHSYSKINILDALYKEIDYKVTPSERDVVLNLFSNANEKSNMCYKIEGWGNKKVFFHREEYLNEIELYIRGLLDKYDFYSIKAEKKDYQLGEE